MLHAQESVISWISRQLLYFIYIHTQSMMTYLFYLGTIQLPLRFENKNKNKIKKIQVKPKEVK